MSREDVIRQIVERVVQNQRLSEEVIGREAPELYAAACEHFGTWNTALRYAGISGRRVKNRRQSGRVARGRRTVINSESGPELVIKEIRRICLTGYDLSASRNVRRDRRLYEAARRNFGSWQRALIAAGVNLEHVRLPTKPRRFNRDELIDQLRQRRETGQTLVWHKVCLDNRTFSTAVKTAFGSWKRALVAAGLADESKNGSACKWDLPRILDAIRLRQQEGKSLQCSRVRKEAAGLVSAARRYFRTWDEAVAAAGVESM